MNLAQYDMRSRSGALCSEPRTVPGSLQTIVLNHAMDRPPDLVVIQFTNVVADNSWAPGETWEMTQLTEFASGVTIVLNAGKVEVLINGAAITLPNRTNPAAAGAAMTAARWRYQVGAFWWAPLLPSL